MSRVDVDFKSFLMLFLLKVHSCVNIMILLNNNLCININQLDYTRFSCLIQKLIIVSCLEMWWCCDLNISTSWFIAKQSLKVYFHNGRIEKESRNVENVFRFACFWLKFNFYSSFSIKFNILTRVIHLAHFKYIFIQNPYYLEFLVNKYTCENWFLPRLHTYEYEKRLK